MARPGVANPCQVAGVFSNCPCTEAVGDLYLSSLIELGLILFFITFIVLAGAQLMLRALERRAGSAT